MPIYEFGCADCGHRFDRLQKLSDPDPDICPQCGKQGLHRCVTAPSFRLAGNGWYETDFKKPGDKKHNLAGADTPPAAAGDGKKDGAPATTGAAPAATPAKTAAGAAESSAAQ